MKLSIASVCCFLIFTCTEEVEAQRKILLGQTAKKGQFPYQVSLTYLNQLFCGGSILNARTILTAGHCIFNTTTKEYKNSVYVSAGTTNLNEISRRKDNMKIRVTAIICHPEYLVFDSNDIALLILESPLKFNNHVQPVKLPASMIPHKGGMILSGWGASVWSKKLSRFPFHLQYITLQPRSLDECRALVDDITFADICTKPVKRATACFGDSGGPAVGEYDGRQYGVVSRLVRECIPGTHNIVTSVYNNLAWIKRNWY